MELTSILIGMHLFPLDKCLGTCFRTFYILIMLEQGLTNGIHRELNNEIRAERILIVKLSTRLRGVRVH